MKWAIAADKISKHFGQVKALREVSFALPRVNWLHLPGLTARAKPR